jgi:hypothetical protein
LAKQEFKQKLAEQDAQEAATPKAATPPRPKHGGLLEDGKLTAARLAEQNRRAVLQTQSAVSQQELSDTDKEAILAAFVLRHRDPSKSDFLYESDFNLNQLHRGMTRAAQQGKVRWDSAGVETVHGILVSGGYYESSSRVRGLRAAPREIPDPEPGPAKSYVPYVAPSAVSVDPRNMSLNELREIEKRRQRNREQPESVEPQELSRGELLALPLSEHKKLVQAQRSAKSKSAGER